MSLSGDFQFFSAFSKLRKITISYVMSVCPPALMSAWNNSAPTGWSSLKYDIPSIIQKFVKNSSFIKIEQNDRYFTWRSVYIFDHILLISS